MVSTAALRRSRCTPRQAAEVCFKIVTFKILFVTLCLWWAFFCVSIVAVTQNKIHVGTAVGIQASLLVGTLLACFIRQLIKKLRRGPSQTSDSDAEDLEAARPVLCEEKQALKRALINRVCPPTEATPTEGDQYSTCIVCLDELAHGSKQRVMYCFHTFHAACLEDWFLHQREEHLLNCPICKQAHPTNLSTARV